MSTEETVNSFAVDLLSNLAKTVEIGFIDPAKLKVADTNNRRDEISESEKLEMRDSVSEIGIVDPILINMNNEIVAGQLRWASALAAGLKSVPFIRKDFKDKFSERIASIVQDYLHHPLSDEDKGNFVKKCLQVDGKTIPDIAKKIGVSELTIRNWLKFEDVPDNIKDDPQTVQTFLDLAIQKKNAATAILSRAPYKNDVQRSLKVVELISKAPMRDVSQMRKDVVRSTTIDEVARMNRLVESSVVMEIRIPKTLDFAFRQKIKAQKLDFVETVIKLIQDFVRQQ